MKSRLNGGEPEAIGPLGVIDIDGLSVLRISQVHEPLIYQDVHAGRGASSMARLVRE